MVKATARAKAERDEALQMVKRLLENYRDNDRKGLGLGPIMQARNLLAKHGIVLGGESDND